MSQFWHKPINLIASAAVIVGMMGLTAGAVSAAHQAARTAAGAKGTVLFSDYEFPDAANNYQTQLVVDASMEDNIAPFGVGTFYDQKIRLQPGMWAGLPKSSNHGLTYTGTIRKGILWSDSTKKHKDPLTSADIVYGWHINKDSGSCAGTCDVITSVSTHGTYGVTFHLAHIDPVFLERDLAPYGMGAINHNWARLGSASARKACLKSVGGCGDASKSGPAFELTADPKINYQTGSGYPTLGPYEIANWASDNSRVVFKPNPLWNARWIGGCCVSNSGGAHIKNFIYVGFATQTGMVDAAATGGTDVTSDQTLLNVLQLKAALKQHKGAFKIINGATYNPEDLWFNVANSPDGGKNVTVKDNAGNTVYSGANPVHNKNVRLALALTFNRPQAIEFAYKVSFKIANQVWTYSTPIPNEKAINDPFADKAIKGAWNGHGWDTPGTSKAIKDALKLMKAAGYKNCSSSHACVTIYLTTNGTGNVARGNFAEFFRNAFKKVGVNLIYEDVESGSHGPFLRALSAGGTAANGWYEIALFAEGLGLPQPDGLVTIMTSKYCPQVVATDVSANYSCIRDGVIDHDFSAAGRTLSNSKRKALFNQMQAQVAKNAYIVETDVRPTIITYDKKVHSVVNDPFSNLVPNWNGWDWKAS